MAQFQPFRSTVDTEDAPDNTEDFSITDESKVPAKLADLFRKKYPGKYDDMKDDDLEKAILAKYPMYKDLASVKPEESKISRPITALKDAVKSAIPDKVKEFAKSIIEGVKGAAETALPSTKLSDYWEGPTYALRHPIDAAELTGKTLLEAHKAQFEKAKSAPTLSEKIGHGAAMLLPLIGPAAANAGEDIAQGNTARGIGKAAGLLAPFAIHGMMPKGSEELSIRQSSREIPYRAPSSTQEPVPIKMTDDSVKPYEPMIKKADKLAKDEYEFAGDSIRQPDIEHRDFGYSDKDSNNTPTDIPPIQQPRDLASSVEETPKEEPKKPFVNPFEKPTAIFKGMQETGDPENPEMPLYDIVGGKSHGSTVGAEKLKELGIDIPETPKDIEKLSGDQLREKAIWDRAVSDWKPPNYATEVSDTRMDELKQKFGGKASEEEPKPSEDDITEMHGGLGGIKPSKRVLEPTKGPYGAALDKLFNSMGNIQELRVKQDIINKTERAKRFAAFAGVDEGGVKGAAQSLSKLKGEFEKVDLDKIQMTQPQADSLFTAVKRAKITEGEKARGYTALFKLLNGSELPQRNELRILDDVFGNGFASRVTEMHGGIGGTSIKLSKLANTWKSMQNALSLAAPLRHGIGMVARKEFYPAFADMFKFFGNKEHFDASMQAIEDHPNYLPARENGLFIAKSGSLLNSEEEFLNSYAGDIPVVRNVVGASQRAYVGFLNKLRFDVYNTMKEQAESLGNALTTPEYFVDTSDMKTINRLKKFARDNGISDKIEDPKFIDLAKKNRLVKSTPITTKAGDVIANYINVATGRGDLGKLNKMTNELNTLLWSPRMIASRIQMFNPTLYTNLPKGMRLDGLKSLLGIAALGTAIDTLSSIGGAKVTTNILSSDFGKSRFGKEVIDPWGGFQQYIVGAARFLAGKTDNPKVYPPTTRLGVLGQFAKSKESPAASLAHTILTAKKFTGKSLDPSTAGGMIDEYGNKTSIQSEVGKQFVPIFVQDLHDLYKNEPKWSENIGLDSALIGASLAGMEQSYPAPQQKGILSIRKPQLR